ncbi:MAG: PaaI family thioesterase [Desulforhopalus sp.]|nr:PaaI family thioesterase [Desulforhopalus sp.]
MKNELFNNVRNDQFAKYLGIEIREARDGYAVTELILNENHLNGVGRVQGGVIFTLADYAFAVAANSDGCPTVGMNVNITYFKAPTGKKLRAEAIEITKQKRISGYQVSVFDEDGSLVSIFSGLGYRKTP